MKDVSNMGMSQSASVISNKEDNISLGVIDYFTVECYDIDGNFKWKETIKNLVTSQGLDYIINCGFSVSQSQLPSWYVGLKLAGTPLAADTAANLPNGNTNWNEYPDYYLGSPAEPETRPALTLADTGTGTLDNSASVATFTIESPAQDVAGVFVVDSDKKESNSAATVLYGVGDFTGGAKTGLASGDTLNVTVTLTATSA
jgi:hypothetical protein